tara:strand:+ start:674 stop:874 length:201 start_codon:yes stop_codon:yes gene_type:complete
MGIYKRLKEAPEGWKPEDKKICLARIEEGIKRNENIKKTATGDKLAEAEEKIAFLTSKKEEISALE